MRFIAFLAPVALATPALSHPGHIAGLAGHDHWIAGAAIGAAIAVGGWALVKGWRRDDEEAAEADTSDDADEPRAVKEG